MYKNLIAVMLTAVACLAQTTTSPAPQTAPAPGSISGVVRDAGTGTPLADVKIFGTKGVQATTDSEGRYSLRGLQPGLYRVSAYTGIGARGGFAGYGTKFVNLTTGQNLASVDFHLRAMGEISGKVLDENKEPVPGLTVFLIAREYTLGALRHVYASIGKTDDQGEYRLQRVEPGRAYLVMAENRIFKLDAVSDAPADPRLRKRVAPPTYYPDSPLLDGAQPLVLRSGERREGVDIRMTRSRNYCVEGVLESGTGPAELSFQIGAQRPTSGASGDGAVFMAVPGGKSGPDGRIRICNLHPGDYQITAYQTATGSPEFYGSAPLTITDADVRNFRVAARPRIPVPGEVVWDGPPPEKPVDSRLAVGARPLTRSQWRGETLNVESSVPGEFSFPGLLMDDYGIDTRNLPAGLYIKDITYGGFSILREPLRAGSAMGNAMLRIVLSRNGGTIAAKVADKDGNPVPNSYVLIVPASANSEGALAAAFISGQTDQNGAYTSAALAPGKYYVLATAEPVDKSPESIGKLWRARIRAQDIELGPGTAMALTLAPVSIE